MKRFTLTFCALILWFSTIAQFPCIDDDGIIQNDELPGCFFCNSFFLGSTGGATTDSLDLDFSCGTIDGNQWFTVFANEEGKIRASLTANPCYKGTGYGAEMIFYDFNLNPVSSCFDHCGSNGTSGVLEATNLTPGEQYLLMIDKCTPTDSCDLSLFIDDQNVLPNVELRTFKVVPNRIDFCVPNEAFFHFTPLAGISDYFWDIPDIAVVLEGGGLQDTFARIQFINDGLKSVGVTPFIDCRLGEASRWLTRVQKHQINRWEDRCPGSPVKIGDQVFTESGKYEVIFKNTSPYDCDSIVSLTLQIADTSQPIIQCVQDTFLNNISINWDRKDLADNYQVFINDSLVSSQSFVGYIYNPNFVGEEIDIKIQPSWALGCDFAPGYATCTAAILSNSREVSGKNDAIVFPNPSSGTFEILSEEKIERIEVLDFSGKERKVVFESTFSLANLVSGVYLLKIRFQNNDKTIFRKVLKI